MQNVMLNNQCPLDSSNDVREYTLFLQDLSRFPDGWDGIQDNIARMDYYAAQLPASLSPGERLVQARILAMVHTPVVVIPHGLLTGMILQGRRGYLYQKDSILTRWGRETARRQLEDGIPIACAAPGHIGWHWERVLYNGIDGLIHILERRLERARLEGDDSGQEFCRRAIMAWNGVLEWNDAYCEALKKHIDSLEDGIEKDEAGEMLRICQKVPRFPATTFHEALQSFYFQHLAIMFEGPNGGNGPGRVDVLLWPYLQRDLQAGRIDMVRATRLIDELYDRFEARLKSSDGWVESVMVGGSFADGSNAVNPLSELLLERYIGRKQTHPHVYVRWREDDPEHFHKLTLDYILDGTNRAQIYNEAETLKAFGDGRFSQEDVVDYMAGGCMELSSQGRSSDLLFSRVVNAPRWFEETLKAAPDDVSYDDLRKQFRLHVRNEMTKLAIICDYTSKAMAEYRPAPLISTLIDDCIAKARDQQDGGARCNDCGIAFPGLPTIADELTALKHAVYGPNAFVSMKRLKEAISRNYEGEEELRLLLRNLPKYGMGDADADAICNEVINEICGLATKTVTRFGGRLRPMLFNFLWTPSLSQELGARPDGAFAGEYIGHGVTPAPIALGKVPLTTAMNSAVTLDCKCVQGGATSMWDCDPELVTPEVMEAILKRFFEGGGMIFQGNMTDWHQLELALEHPENYPPMIVRVGGFSSFFHNLNIDVRREIVQRHRHRQ